MKNLIALGLSVLLLLAACSRSSVLKIVEQGSFAVGGTVLTDSLGRTYHGDHAYMFATPPVRSTAVPSGTAAFTRHLTGARDSRISFCVGDSPRILSISLVGGMPGGERRQLLCRPFLMKRSGSTVFVSVFGLIFSTGCSSVVTKMLSISISGR